jgi:hypothetical protein
MADPMHRRITRWIIDHLLWDTTGTVRGGFRGGLWAARKLFVAVAVSGLLTWREWVEHHPPEIVLVELIHFVFVLAAIALVVYIGRWFGRGDENSTSRQSKGPHSE